MSSSLWLPSLNSYLRPVVLLACVSRVFLSVAERPSVPWVTRDSLLPRVDIRALRVKLLHHARTSPRVGGPVFCVLCKRGGQRATRWLCFNVASAPGRCPARFSFPLRQRRSRAFRPLRVLWHLARSGFSILAVSSCAQQQLMVLICTSPRTDGALCHARVRFDEVCVRVVGASLDGA